MLDKSDVRLALRSELGLRPTARLRFYDVGYVEMVQRVAYDERGYRVGQSHHNSSIPDSVVRLIRDLREYDGMSYGQIAARVGCSRQHVHRICTYEIRASIPSRWEDAEA